jgi:hypothetical protein
VRYHNCDSIFAEQVELIVKIFSAVVWGASAKHARGQKVGLEHILEDEDGQAPLLFFPFGNTTDAFSLESCPYLQEINKTIHGVALS